MLDTDEIRRHFLVLPSNASITKQPVAKPCRHLLHLILAISAIAATVDSSQRKYNSYLSCSEFVSSIANLEAIGLARVSAKCKSVCITFVSLFLSLSVPMSSHHCTNELVWGLESTGGELGCLGLERLARLKSVAPVYKIGE